MYEWFLKINQLILNKTILCYSLGFIKGSEKKQVLVKLNFVVCAFFFLTEKALHIIDPINKTNRKDG